MKKRMSLVFVLILALVLSVAVGFKGASAKNSAVENHVKEDNIEQVELFVENEEVMVTQETQISETLTQTTENESVLIQEKSGEIITDEILSAEDKAVKSEISKYSNTKVDFRYNKQEMIQDKKINMTFSELDKTFDNKKIKYTNAENDTFVFELDSGKLFYARIRNATVPKTEKSVGIETASQIAKDYILDKCDLDGYTLWVSKETEEGYMFIYSKYYSGCRSDESFGVGVGFDGSIFYIRDNTDLFNGVELVISTDWIEQQKNEILSEYKDTTAEVVEENTYITLKNDKPCLFIAIQYGVSPDGKKGASLAIHTVPIS